MKNNFVTDLTRVILLAVACFGIGLAVNHLRGSPLSLSYHSPEQRLVRDLNQLIAAPAFRLSDLDPVQLDEFKAIVATRKAVIIDARTGSFYDNGHVPGAINLSRANFARDYLHLRSTLDGAKSNPVIVYCSGGECHDSRLVASALISLGFSQVRIFTGGWDAWTSASGPVEH